MITEYCLSGHRTDDPSILSCRTDKHTALLSKEKMYTVHRLIDGSMAILSVVLYIRTSGSRELLCADNLEYIVRCDVISNHHLFRLLHSLLHPLQR